MTGALAHDEAVALRDALSGDLRTGDGASIEIPPATRAVLLRALDVMESSPDAVIFAADDQLSTGQVAEILGVSRTTVTRLVDKGELRASGSAVHRRVQAAEVRRYQEQRRQARNRAVHVLAQSIDDQLPPDHLPGRTR
jgi:excisionase family DNA binding protein